TAPITTETIFGVRFLVPQLRDEGSDPENCLCAYLLFGDSEMFVIHRDVVLPLFRDVVLWKDGRHRTGGLTSTTIDAFFRMDIKHRRCLEIGFVLLGVDAVHRAGVDARRILGADARFA